MAFLTILTQKNQQIDLPELPRNDKPLNLSIGRMPDCFVPFPGIDEISRAHASIELRKAGYSIIDLGSLNGTAIIRQTDSGDKRIELTKNQPYLLQNCDVIELGKKHRIRFQNGPLEIGPAPVSSVEVASPEYTIGPTSSLTATPMQEVLNGILEIGRTLATKFKEDEIGPPLIDQLIRIFPKGRRFFLYATVPNSNRLRLLSWKINPSRRRSIINVNDDDIPRYSRTIYRTVIEEQKSALMTETDAANSISESMLDMDIRSVMVAPVITPDGEVKGMVQVDTDKNSEFKPTDLEILKVVALQVGATMQMADLHRKALEQSKLKSDLENASDILNLFLPQSMPKISGFDFFVEYKPREDVGGDFYDFIRLDENRMAICVCDVVGKGLPAAMIMARLSSELKHVIRTESEPCKAFTKLDEILTPLLNPPSSFESRFVSMSLAVIDLKTLKMTMVNAGHPPLLLKRADGRVDQPDSKLSGHLMGVDFGDPKFKEDNYFELGEVQLAPGDTVVYYSDGVTDARSKAGKLFCSPEENHLLQVVEATSGGPTNIGKTIVEAIRKFSEGTPQFDDITLSCFGPVIR